MSHSSKFGDRRGRMTAAVTVVLLLVGGTLVVTSLSGAHGPPQPDAQQSAPAPAASPTWSPTSSRAPGSHRPGAQATPDFGPTMEPSPPVSLAIPSIGVNTTGIVDL